jgi:beta-lactamase superfamily II metal-dependent hydrolase
MGIYLVDVGQGDATVVLLPDDQGAVVFDCKDAGPIQKLLTHWRVPKIAAVIASHLDIDHIAGLSTLLLSNTMPIEAVYVAVDRPLAGSSDVTKAAGELVETALSGARSCWKLFPVHEYPASILSGPDWGLRLLAPPGGMAIKPHLTRMWDDANEYSAVLKVEMGGRSVLIGGDAPLVSWEAIAATDRRADVFRIPHHGGALDDGGVPSGWDAARLYSEVGARVAVVSVGTKNQHGHPDAKWVAPIMQGRCRTLCTQVTPSCEPSVETDPVVWRDKVLRGYHFAEPPWRHLTDKRLEPKKGLNEVPCAGTVVIKLREKGPFEVVPPPSGEHDRIVGDWSKPQCRAPLSSTTGPDPAQDRGASAPLIRSVARASMRTGGLHPDADLL